MANKQLLEEEDLIDKVQSGEFGWLEYIKHQPEEIQNEFTDFCQERELTAEEDAAGQFMDWKSAQLENDSDN